MPKIITSTDKEVIFKSESHKLHNAATVLAGASIKRGQPVKLDPATGHLTPLVAADNVRLMVGISTHNAAEGTVCTYMAKGFCTVYGIAEGALNAGPAHLGTALVEPNITSYHQISQADALTAANMLGWVMEPVADTENCRIVIAG